MKSASWTKFRNAVSVFSAHASLSIWNAAHSKSHCCLTTATMSSILSSHALHAVHSTSAESCAEPEIFHSQCGKCRATLSIDFSRDKLLYILAKPPFKPPFKASFKPPFEALSEALFFLCAVSTPITCHTSWQRRGPFLPGTLPHSYPSSH